MKSTAALRRNAPDPELELPTSIRPRTDKKNDARITTKKQESLEMCNSSLNRARPQCATACSTRHTSALPFSNVAIIVFFNHYFLDLLSRTILSQSTKQRDAVVSHGKLFEHQLYSHILYEMTRDGAQNTHSHASEQEIFMYHLKNELSKRKKEKQSLRYCSMGDRTIHCDKIAITEVGHSLIMRQVIESNPFRRQLYCIPVGVCSMFLLQPHQFIESTSMAEMSQMCRKV